MSNLRPLIETRIRTQVPALKEVAGAADMANIMSGRLPLLHLRRDAEAREAGLSVQGRSAGHRPRR